MPGTREGGIKAGKTNCKLHGKDFYKRIGRKGGSVCGIKKGFALNIERAKAAGRKGGKISRRGKSVKRDNRD